MSQLFDVAALHDRGKCIRKLMHNHLRHIRTRSSRNITISDAVFSNQRIIAKSRCISCSRRNTHMCLQLKINL
jgi:hypothetical protein